MNQQQMQQLVARSSYSRLCSRPGLPPAPGTRTKKSLTARSTPKGPAYDSGAEWAYSQPVLAVLSDTVSFLNRSEKKGSLDQANNTASPASLAWVELMHWLLFFAAIWVSYCMFAHFTAPCQPGVAGVLSPYTFMLCAFSLVQVSVAEHIL